MKPRIIIDANIPFIKGVLEAHAEVSYVEGSEISLAHCANADALIVRTRTRCDRELLAGTPVKIIATATAGTDHIDLEYCQAHGVEVQTAKGCNAWAVVQWVFSVLGIIDKTARKTLWESTVGIVGCGEIGSRLALALELYGVKVLKNDPPREKQGERGFVPLELLMRESDIVTIHTPLTTEGAHPTHHLVNRELLHSTRSKPYILHAARGGVVDDFELLEAKHHHRISGFAVDVYEGEPDVPQEFLEEAFVATPHIAGYSAEGKLAASRRAIEAVSTFFGFSPLPSALQSADDAKKPFLAGLDFQNLVRAYDAQADSRAFRAKPQQMESLRVNYHYRHDWRGYEIANQKLAELLERYP